MKSLLAKGTWHTLLVLLGIFVLSVVVRIPNLNRPLSKHHEFVTAISLRVLQVWDAEGGSTFGYSPVMNYSGIANKHINNHASPTGGMMDADGNYYYVSHPPFGYMLPYFVLKAVGTSPTVLSLEVFHLLVNLFTGLFVYAIVCLLCNRRVRGSLNSTALIAFVLYLFSSAVLWFQSNTYMSDMLVHFFFVIGIYLMLKMRGTTTKTKGIQLFFALNLLAMVYTSWIGVFFGAVTVFYGVFKWKGKNGMRVATLSTGAVLGGLLLTYLQYSSINGSDAFLSHLMQRLHVRGSNASVENGSFVLTKVIEITTILFNYVVNYLPLLALLVIGLILTGKKRIQAKLKEPKWSVFLWFGLVPIILLHLALLNYSGHDFTVLYASCFFAVVGAFLIQRNMSRFRMHIIGAASLVSIGLYFYVNRPGEISMRGDRYAESMELGEKIKQEAQDDEVIFLITKMLDPMVVVYAERNIVSVASMEDFEEKRSVRSPKKWRLFKSDE